MEVRDLEPGDWDFVPVGWSESGQVRLLRDHPEQSRRLLAVTIGPVLAGVAGWRVTPEGTKAVSPVAWYDHDAALIALFKHIINRNPGGAFWCKYMLGMTEWCKSLGLTPDTVEPDAEGAIIFRFTAEQAGAFARE